MTVAALYVDARGPYPRMARGETFRELGPHGEPYCREWGPPRDIDAWDITRDARLYEGPHPIVAHPPCKHWGRLRHLAHVGCTACDWTGPREFHNGHCFVERPISGASDEQCVGDIHSDADCAPRAVEQVRRWGGVLEHPAASKLWEHCNLNAPASSQWSFDRWAPFCEAISETDLSGGYTIELDQVEWGHVARKPTWLYLVGVPRSALESPPFPGREPTHWCSGTYTKGKKGTMPPGIKVASAQQRRRTPPLFAEYLIRLARSARRP